MGKKHYAVIVTSILLVAILFFGFDTKPPASPVFETSGPETETNGELISLVESATNSLTEDEARMFRTLENLVRSNAEDSTTIEALKQLSGAWFDKRQFVVAGYYAERVAEMVEDAEAWSIAGSTYAFELTSGSGDDEGLLQLASSRAVDCYEYAISMDPDNTDYRINLAICYVEYPPKDNPMKGIQSLLALNQSEPDNTSVLYHLARFGLQTGQTDKAIARLERAISIDPDQNRLYCLMSQAYQQQGQADKAAEYAARCNED